MNDKIDDHLEDDEFDFCCNSHPFHVFWKNFPKKNPLFRFRYYNDRIPQGSRVPLTKVRWNQEKYIIIMELPGITKDEINLEVTDRELWFYARSEEFNKEFKHRLSFKRLIRPKETTAKLRRGILTITAPLLEKVPKTKVAVE
ncbi:MAG: Hsp20/alpha crystallin family protein [Promethearchaeota archaeon]